MRESNLVIKFCKCSDGRLLKFDCKLKHARLKLLVLLLVI